MGLSKYNKLKSVQKVIFHEGLITTRYLEMMGAYPQLVFKYVKAGWLEKIGTGAYKHPELAIDWKVATKALHKQLQIPIHVGAKTVFQLMGRAHYLSSHRVHLFYPARTHIPKWFCRDPLIHKVEVHLHRGGPFTDWTLGLSEQDGVRISSLERAILEQLYLVDRFETLEESYKLFESLTSMRSGLVQELLEACTSIKTKRLFLLLGRRLSYPWFNKLDLSKVNFGKGPRQLTKHGVYDRESQLVVPNEWGES